MVQLALLGHGGLGQENKYSSGRAENFFAEGAGFVCAGKEIFLGTKINFRAHENLFACGRKFG